MKSLPFQRDAVKNRVTVECAERSVSVYSMCGYCRHCQGVRAESRVTPSPQINALEALRRGSGADAQLMNAAMTFNMLVRDGTALECDDDTNEGFRKLY